MKYVKAHIILLLLLLCPSIKAQNLFHQDIFYGGVTAGGVSTGQGAMSPGDTISLPLYIEPGSFIRKAYLFAYSQGYPLTLSYVVNGTNYSFDSTGIIMNVDHVVDTLSYCTMASITSPVRLYYLDITSNLDSSVDVFDIFYPRATLPSYCNTPGCCINWGWFSAFLYIEYENSSLPKVASTIWINDKNFTGIESYAMSGMNVIDNSFPIGLSIFSDRACSLTDANDVFINLNYLGAIGGSDSLNGQWNCAGSKGHYYYQNNTLYGLDDDTANMTMNATDALADIAPYLMSSVTGYSLDLIHSNNISAGRPNNNLMFLNTYTTPCDTFTTSIITDTVICKGDSIQLFAGGGSNYYWQPNTGLGNPNIANPMASPDSTTLYVVRIENTPGCSRTEKVLVKVNEPPKITSMSIDESICGNDDGQVSIVAIGTNPLQYSIGSGFQNGNTFSNLTTGNYTITILDNNGCSSDTSVFVPEINPINALFTTNPQTGTEPLSVNLNNLSTGTNNYNWFIDGIFLSNNFNETYTFDSSGIYTVTLIAYNNLPQCADSFSLQIIVYDSLMVQIPNVFTPNNDGVNDVFSIKLESVKEISVSIINRWGNIITEYNNAITVSPATIDIWNGRTTAGEKVADGVYFYIIELTDRQHKKYKYNGTIQVFN